MINRDGMANKYVGTTKYKKKKIKNIDLKHPKRMSKKANSKCICGSGKKYKKCCMKYEKMKRQQNRQNNNEFYISSSDSDSE